jgi:hypothetical protein
MRPQDEFSNHEQLKATAAELQAMADLIQKYPAEAQLIMAALEDGLTLGAMHVMETDSIKGEAVDLCRRSSIHLRTGLYTSSLPI